VRTAARVAVLSHASWTSRFGADSGIVGRTLVLNGVPQQVIGVTGAEYQDPFGPIDVWLPATSGPNPAWLTREGPAFWAVGLMRPGVIAAEASADLSRIAAELAAEFPATNAGMGVGLQPLRDSLVGEVRPALLILLGFVALILCIACANIANLQLARATARRREMSLRAALGAGRARLVRQLLTESVVLALIGGTVGMLAARWGISGLLTMVPEGLPSFGEVGLDRRVLLFSLAITIGAGLVFGAVPARYGTRGQLADALQGRGADLLGGSRVRQLFVAVQLGLCIVLLIGAGLLARSFSRLQQVPVGFNPDHLVTAELRLPVTKYGNDTVVVAFGQQALERLRATPGVRSAALVDAIPLSGNWGMSTYRVEGRATPDSLLPTAQMNAVSDGFFKTMEIPLVMGREFSPTDRLGAPMVAIVNRELARRTWPGESPLGKRITLTGPPEVEATVVGVAGNVKQLTLSGADEPQLYVAKAQNGGIFHSVAARTAGDPDAMADAVREAIWAVDRDQPVWKIRSMAALLDHDLAPRRFTARLTAGFALLALLLALIGVYGVMSYVVAQRTREIGIRMALGAARGEVVRLVLGRGLRIVAAGIGLGLVAAYAGARAIERQLFGVPAADVTTFVAVPLVLVVVAAVACWVPARRAARVDPAIALSAE
jgi:putative ABC transport system permease protein